MPDETTSEGRGAWGNALARWVTIAVLLLHVPLHVPSAGADDGLRISTIALIESDLFILSYDSDPTNYYRLLAGGAIDDLRPIAMALGRDGPAAFGDLPVGAASRYYAVEAWNLQSPGDADGDGVDDLTELLAGTNPLAVGGPSNLPPSVAIATRVDGRAFRLGDTVDIVATATDPEGDLERVEFTAGASRVGNAGAAPFSVRWRPDRVGSFLLSAFAIDRGGAFAAAPFVSVRVSATNLPPIVSLFAEPIGDLVEPASVRITVVATDPDGRVVEVELAQGAVSLGVSTNATYTVELHGLDAGEHFLQARATDRSPTSPGTLCRRRGT